MHDFLQKLVEDATRRVNSGYYDVKGNTSHEPVSLKRAIKTAKNNAIIAEIKPISPARGPLRPKINPIDAAVKLAKGGAIGLSVLTEPDNFGGGMENLQQVRPNVDLPLLMKDIVVDQAQIHAGKKSGADCILLIESVFSRNSSLNLDDMIRETHRDGLEVLLEVHNEDELIEALKSEADIIGVNNRSLATLETDLNTTIRILGKINQTVDKVLISESGFETANDIRRMKTNIVDGFLIGSSIMLSNNLEGKVREFVLA